MSADNRVFVCPECCGGNMVEVVWGNFFDWDSGKCLDCGYDGYLDSMTGLDSDGSVKQYGRDDDEEDDEE